MAGDDVFDVMRHAGCASLANDRDLARLARAVRPLTSS
jgi:hypothetical protein